MGLTPSGLRSTQALNQHCPSYTHHTTQIWNYDHRKEHVRGAAERILRELNVPKIQQLLIHWPTHLKKVDDATLWPKDADGKHMYELEADYRDTWREMEKLVEEGLVETIGSVLIGHRCVR